MKVIIIGTLLLSSLGPVSPQVRVPGPGGAGSAGGGGSPISFVSGSYRSGTSAASGTTIANSATVAVSAGDHIFACVGNGNNSNFVVSGVTDGANAMTLVKRSTLAGTGNLEIWAKLNATANASSTFTATFNGSTIFRFIHTASFAGTLTAADQSSCNISTCDNFTTATSRQAVSVTTTVADELLLACTSEWDVHSWTAANSFTLLSPSTNSDFGMLYRIVSSTSSSYPGTFANITGGSSNNYLSVFGAFK